MKYIFLLPLIIYIVVSEVLGWNEKEGQGVGHTVGAASTTSTASTTRDIEYLQFMRKFKRHMQRGDTTMFKDIKGID
jgi:hypothetical protein